MLFLRTLNLGLDRLLARPVMISFGNRFYENSPSCDVHIVPDCLNLHVSESPLDSSWLLRHTWGIMISLQAASTLPVYQSHTLMAERLGAVLGGSVCMVLPQWQMGSLTGVREKSRLHTAVWHTWKANARLLLEVPAVLPCSQTAA